MKKLVKKAMLLMTMVVLSLMMTMPSHAAVRLNKKKATVLAGASIQLKVKGTKKKVSWKSSNKAVASVTKKGLVKGKAAGTAKITAKVGKKKLTCKVTVKAAGAAGQTPVVLRSAVVNDHNVTYTFRYMSDKMLYIDIQNYSSGDINLGWTNDFKAVYRTSSGSYDAGLDILGSLQRTSDLEFNRIHAGQTRSYFANLGRIPGELQAVSMSGIYPLNDRGLPEFDWNSFGSVTYTIQAVLQ